MKDQKTPIYAPGAPDPQAAYSHGIKAGPFLFLSGQIGLVPETGQLAEGGLEPEARQTFRNVSAILQAAGAGKADVVKVVVYLADISDWSLLNSIYEEYFAETVLPARTAIAVAALPLGARVELDITAQAKLTADASSGHSFIRH